MTTKENTPLGVHFLLLNFLKYFVLSCSWVKLLKLKLALNLFLVSSGEDHVP